MLSLALHGDLPPAGECVQLTKTAQAPPQFTGYDAHWLSSGTAALAAALLMAKGRRTEIKTPEVILPAYACPDLLSAAKFAGVRPVLVDIEADDPAYSLDALAVAVTRNVVAVVAVNFLGVRERLAEIRRVLSSTEPRALLIEDNAQWFPEPLSNPNLEGDLVCLSFGRGKPVSLLGGGALLVKQSQAYTLPIVLPAKADALLRVKAALFNSLLQRRLYCLVNRNPLFTLGETRYKTLHRIGAMDGLRLEALAANAHRHLHQARQIESSWMQDLSSLGCVGDKLTFIAGDDRRHGRLLRFPVLCCDARLRDSLWQALDRAGLGTSRMYRRVLTKIDGVREVFDLRGNFPGAESFADRLLTLPVHSQVNAADLKRAMDIFSRVL